MIDIIKVTAMTMPITMFEVNGSPKISVPTRIAAIGSNTPSTEALVAPIFRVAIANVAVETMVGNIANFWGSVHCCGLFIFTPKETLKTWHMPASYTLAISPSLSQSRGLGRNVA